MTTPFHSIKAVKDTPLFIFGDHASNHIPDELDNLGLTEADLQRHIAWDIGTDILIRHLCERYGCGGQLAGVSRLVIDLNRSTLMDSLIPEISDGTVVPGNQNLTAEARKLRIERYYDPYHQALSDALEPLEDPLVISIHSFTDKPIKGEWRMTEIGLLVKHDEVSATSMREMFMRMGRNFTVGMNEPYSAHDLNYTIDTHIAPRGFRHLAIEVRQDHLETEAKAKDMAWVLGENIEPIVNRQIVKPILPF